MVWKFYFSCKWKSSNQKIIFGVIVLFGNRFLKCLCHFSVTTFGMKKDDKITFFFLEIFLYYVICKYAISKEMCKESSVVELTRSRNRVQPSSLSLYRIAHKLELKNE